MPSAKSKPVELDEYHAHEALDRTNMFVDMLESQLANHPYITQDPKKVKQVDNTLKALGKLYQQIGEEHL